MKKETLYRLKNRCRDNGGDCELCNMVEECNHIHQYTEIAPLIWTDVEIEDMYQEIVLKQKKQACTEVV